jgi:hypothetical protein
MVHYSKKSRMHHFFPVFFNSYFAKTLNFTSVLLTLFRSKLVA